MRPTFHRIAYEALDVCNAVEMAALEAAVASTGLQPHARALDIGSGNGGVAIRLAERFGFEVTSVELDPAMAELARERIAASTASARIILHEARSDVVLEAGAPFDLIVALGTTEPIGGGVRDPRGMFKGLARRLTPGGWLLWGDLVWTAEPSQPLRQIVELNNTYADHAGWQAAAEAAGLKVVSAEVSPPALWDRYRTTMMEAVAAWLAAHPDHPAAEPVRGRAHQLNLMFGFGDGALGFGLYLLRAPPGALT
jgi:cyclopropane fatty-acyl-phospholipid synthase-like methyltransferase